MVIDYMSHGLRAALGHENRRALARTVRNTTQGQAVGGGGGGGGGATVGLSGQ